MKSGSLHQQIYPIQSLFDWTIGLMVDVPKQKRMDGQEARRQPVRSISSHPII